MQLITDAANRPCFIIMLMVMGGGVCGYLLQYHMSCLTSADCKRIRKRLAKLIGKRRCYSLMPSQRNKD